MSWHRTSFAWHYIDMGWKLQLYVKWWLLLGKNTVILRKNWCSESRKKLTLETRKELEKRVECGPLFQYCGPLETGIMHLPICKGWRKEEGRERGSVDMQRHFSQNERKQKHYMFQQFTFLSMNIFMSWNHNNHLLNFLGLEIISRFFY